MMHFVKMKLLFRLNIKKKKMKYLFIIMFFAVGSTYSQTRYQAEINIGKSFQSELKLDDDILEHSSTFVIRFGANVQIPIYQQLYIETGVFGKYNRAKNGIEKLGFTANSLRLQIPLYLGYKINEKWNANLGVSVENNRDFNSMDMRKTHNLRYDLLTKLIYKHTDQLHYVLYSNWSLSNMPDFYTFTNPKNGILVGLVYQLKKNNKKKKDEK